MVVGGVGGADKMILKPLFSSPPPSLPSTKYSDSYSAGIMAATYPDFTRISALIIPATLLKLLFWYQIHIPPHVPLLLSPPPFSSDRRLTIWSNYRKLDAVRPAKTPPSLTSVERKPDLRLLRPLY